MAKKPLNPTKPTAQAQNPPATSIDDIFASKPKPTSTSGSIPKSKSQPSAGPSTSASTSASISTSQTTEKKKKKSKTIAEFNPDTEDPPLTPEKAEKVIEREVETVLDPSVMPPIKSKSTVVESAVPADLTKKKKRRDRRDVEEDEIFADSRGDGPRTSSPPPSSSPPLPLRLPSHISIIPAVRKQS